MPVKDITDIKIGVLGGGQLGRMMIQSAINYNLDISILDPDENAPCAHLVKNFSVGKLTDEDHVYQWGQQFDLLTIEIENVSVAALKRLQEEGKKVYPQPEIIELIQDKRKQKTFYKANRIPTSDFVLTENASDVAIHKEMLPAVNKLGTEGYDGRGVQMIRTEADLAKAFDKPGLLEKLVDFEKELSVVVARNEKGDMECFPVVELSYHPEQNLVEFLFAPAQINKEIEDKAYKLAKDVIEKLGMVGLLAVEMFLTKEGDILVNEVAPRTHNSGHHTIEANHTSQFEQHLRAILNLPLGSAELITPAAMVNLLGEDGHTGNAQYEGMETCMAMKGVYVHLYGKKLTKPFRKMGHVTITDDSIDSLKVKARKVKETLKVKSIMASPKVGIIMGSKSDLPVMQQAADILEELGVDYELTIVSAHRTPHRMLEYAEGARGKGLQVIIAGAGGAAHLPGMVASLTTLPVIGVPVKSSNSIDGWDSILSILQMPGGIPVATVALDGAKNAGILAAEIVGATDHSIATNLQKHKDSLRDKVMESVKSLEK